MAGGLLAHAGILPPAGLCGCLGERPRTPGGLVLVSSLPL